MQGQVLFDRDPGATPMVRVVPTVTTVMPAVAHTGAAITVHGSGFSHTPLSNVVRLPAGRGCVVTRSDRHYLVCTVLAAPPTPGPSPVSVPHPSNNHLSHVSGFQLAIAPASLPASDGSSMPGCGVAGSGLEGFATARDCIGALADFEREIVTVANDLLWPVLHPLRSADGAFRTEQFVAHGVGMLLPPSPGVFALRLDCSRLDRRNLCMAKVSAGNGTVQVLDREEPELWLPNDNAARSTGGYRVELVVSHIEHSEQIVLTIEQVSPPARDRHATRAPPANLGAPSGDDHEP